MFIKRQKPEPAEHTISGRRVRRGTAVVIRSRGDRHRSPNIGKLQRRRARNKAASATRRAQRKAGK